MVQVWPQSWHTPKVEFLVLVFSLPSAFGVSAHRPPVAKIMVPLAAPLTILFFFLFVFDVVSANCTCTFSLLHFGHFIRDTPYVNFNLLYHLTTTKKSPDFGGSILSHQNTVQEIGSILSRLLLRAKVHRKKRPYRKSIQFWIDYFYTLKRSGRKAWIFGNPILGCQKYGTGNQLKIKPITFTR